MKNNLKQQAWSARKVRNSKFKMLAWMFTCLFAVFAVFSLVMAIQGEASPLAYLLTGLGTVKCAGMALIGNIEDQTDIYTQANPIACEVRLVALEQIDNTVAFPTPNTSREMGAATLKTGEVAHKFYSHNEPTLSSTGEKGDYTTSPSKEFTLVLANSFRDQVLNFVENYAGGKFILYFRKVETSQWYIIGSYDKTVTFNNYELKGDGDGSVAICKFSHNSIRQFYKCPEPAVETPVTVDADSTTLAIENSSVYQLSDNTAATVISAVSGIATADVGRSITIYGSGGDYPATIEDSDVFVLAFGTTWTGNSGSRITFRILDTGTLSEIERHQT